MKRTTRVAGLMAIALVASFLVIGCGDSPTSPLITGDDGGSGGEQPDKGNGGGAVLVVDQDQNVEK